MKAIFLIICLPALSALIGWLTNRLAIKMLFRPSHPTNFYGFKWQGLIPRRQKDIAYSTGEVIEREVIDRHILRQEIEKVELRPMMDDLAHKLVVERVGPKLKQVPLLGSFVNDSVLRTLEGIAAEELKNEAPNLVTLFASEAEKHLDIKRLAENRIAQFDVEKLESIVLEVASKEFRNIEILGGFLGYGIGLIQILIIGLTGGLS